jgi:hypothetical protein
MSPAHRLPGRSGFGEKVPKKARDDDRTPLVGLRLSQVELSTDLGYGLDDLEAGAQ